GRLIPAQACARSSLTTPCRSDRIETSLAARPSPPKRGPSMTRFSRWFAAFAVAAVAVAPGAFAQKVLKFIPQADLRILDPIATTAYITRNHGYMVYDTLFAIDDKFQVKPQMVDKYDVSKDGLTYTFTLRPGLKFHDGAPVRSADCIASI